MYAEKEIQSSLLFLHLFAVLRYVQKIQIPTVSRSRAKGLILYSVAIWVIISILPSIEGLDWRQEEGILFTWNQKYFAVRSGFQVSDSIQLLLLDWEFSSIWLPSIMSGLFLLWHMVCNICFWLDFYLFLFALERYPCLGTCHLQYSFREMHLASGMKDGGIYVGLYFCRSRSVGYKKCYVQLHNVFLKTTSGAMVTWNSAWTRLQAELRKSKFDIFSQRKPCDKLQFAKWFFPDHQYYLYFIKVQLQ